MRLRVRVIPRASKNGITGRRGDALLIRLAAPPVDGAANDALITYLADVLGQPRRNVTIISGHKSRDKRVNIEGLTQTAGEARLSAMLNGTPDDPR